MKTKLDDAARRTYHAPPHDIARLGFAVAHALNPDAPAPARLRESVHVLARDIAAALAGAERPLIVSGTSLGSDAVIQAAANIAGALCGTGKHAGLCYAVPECNSMGLALMQPRPLGEAFSAIESTRADTLIILENDLLRRAGEAAVNSLLEKARHIIVLDHLINDTSAEAEIILPAGTFAETQGTLVNNEGRAQRHERVFPPALDIQESWKWLRDILNAAGMSRREWSSADDVIADLASALPLFKPALELSPSAAFRVAGQKIPRQPHRFSGRTAMLANVSVHEPKPAEDPGSPLSFSMEGYEGAPPAPLITRYWRPGWNSVQALNAFQQEVGGPLPGGDPGKRLLEISELPRTPYFRGIPAAFKARSNEWLIVPLHHCFGSEELSLLSPGIADRSPKPSLALSPEDAARLHITAGEEADVVLDGVTHRLEARMAPELRSGVAGLHLGDRGMIDLASTRYCTITKAS